MNEIGSPMEEIPQSVFFAKQIAKNSCATQAMLAILMNQSHKINLGPVLTEFREFSALFDPSM